MIQWLDHHQLAESDRAKRSPWLFWSARTPVSLAVAQEAVNRIVERHETFRTTFELGTDGVPTQVVHDTSPNEPLVMVKCDISSTPDDAAKTLGQSLAIETVDLLDNRPWRGGFIVTDSGVTRIVIVAHHILLDGQAVDALRHEFDEVIYSAPGPTVTSPPLQPRDISIQQRSHMGRAQHRADVTYWQEQLLATPNRLQFDAPKSRGSNTPIEFQGASASAAKAVWIISRRCRSFPSMVVLAAYCLTLKELARQSTIPIEMLVSNRDTSQMKGVVGCLFEPLLINFEMKSLDSFDDAVTLCTERWADSQQYGGYDYAAAKRLTAQLGRQRGINIRSGVVYNFVQESSPTSNRIDEWRHRVDGLTIEDVLINASHPSWRNFDIVVDFRVAVSDQVASFAITSCADGIDGAVIQQLMRGVMELLISAAATPERMRSPSSHPGAVERRDGSHLVLVDNCMIDPREVASIIESHDDVVGAEVTTEMHRGRLDLVADVTCRSVIDEGSLIAHFFDNVADASAAMCPQRFILRSDADSTDRPSGQVDPLRATTHRTRAMVDAVAAVNGISKAQMDPELSYSQIGDIERVPAVLIELRSRGFDPPPLYSFYSVRSLRRLAESMMSAYGAHGVERIAHDSVHEPPGTDQLP